MVMPSPIETVLRELVQNSDRNRTYQARETYILTAISQIRGLMPLCIEQIEPVKREWIKGVNSILGGDNIDKHWEGILVSYIADVEDKAYFEGYQFCLKQVLKLLGEGEK